jgi:hypothetical protein
MGIGEEIAPSLKGTEKFNEVVVQIRVVSSCEAHQTHMLLHGGWDHIPKCIISIKYHSLQMHLIH